MLWFHGSITRTRTHDVIAQVLSYNPYDTGYPSFVIRLHEVGIKRHQPTRSPPETEAVRE